MVYRKDWGQPAAGGQGFARTMKAYGRKINLATTDLNLTGNVVGAFLLPANFKVINWIGPAIPAMGTGLKLDIGDAGSANRFLAADGTAAAGGALPVMASTGLFFTTTQDTEVQVKINTQTASPVAGVLEFYIYGFIL